MCYNTTSINRIGGDMKTSYKFKDDQELLGFILSEVKKYTGCYYEHKVLYSYNRLTVEELAQEVFLKILRSVNSRELNKSYVRQAVVFVCIDEYRRYRLNDMPTTKQGLGSEEFDVNFQENLETPQAYEFELTERLMNLKMFEAKELEVVMLLIEGKRNPEVRKELNIPKMTYYTLLKRLRRKYIEAMDLEISESEQALGTLLNSFNNQ